MSGPHGEIFTLKKSEAAMLMTCSEKILPPQILQRSHAPGMIANAMNGSLVLYMYFQST